MPTARRAGASGLLHLQHQRDPSTPAPPHTLPVAKVLEGLYGCGRSGLATGGDRVSLLGTVWEGPHRLRETLLSSAAKPSPKDS